MVISAFKHWEEVVSFDDEASLVGSFPLLTNVYTASLPRTESSNVSKFLASHKIGGGLDDYCLHSIDSKGLRYEQALNFQESLNHSFDVDHLNFFDTDLPTQNVNLKLQSDLQDAVDNFLATRAAIGRARMRWTKLFSTLIWFSIRVALRKQVREHPRYNNRLIKKYICKRKRHSLQILLKFMPYIYSYIEVLCGLP